MRRTLSVLAILAGLGCSISFGQFGIVDCVGQPPVHVAHLRGSVFDPTGVVIPNVNLTLKRGDTVVAQTASDRNGRFDLRLPSGKYELSVQSEKFRAIPLKIHVGFDVHSLLRPGELRWILEVTGMNCSWATTRVAVFEKEIRVFNERLKKDKQSNALQK